MLSLKSSARALRLLAALACLALLQTACGGGGSSGQNSDPAGVSVSGTISPAATSRIDGDTNDPFSANLDNDRPEAAQSLPNPVILGGFVTSTGTGLSGDRFADQGDVQDWYRLTLAAGQSVSLQISDHDGTATTPDLDLYLTTPLEPFSPVQSSTAVDSSEEVISVASSGEYYLIVDAYTGTSNYLLSVGQPLGSGSPETLRIEDDFVPGELVVRFREGPTRPAAQAAALNLQQVAGGGQRATLLRLGDDADREMTFRALGVAPGSRGSDFKSADPRQQLKLETIRAVKALRQREGVVSADLNYIRQPFRIPADEYYSYQWHYPLINLPQAWDVTTGDSSVVVAVIDTGVLMSHPDLDERLCSAVDDCRGYDFISDPSNSNDGDGIDADPDDPGDDLTPGSSSFHGTHVAGTIGAESNQAGAGSGVAGVDWNSRIMPLRVLGLRGGTSYDIMQSLRYAAGLANDSGTLPAKTADVINLSFGGSGSSQSEQDLYSELYDLGIVLVAAAGNDSSSAPAYPAAYQGVFSVGAVDLNKRLAYYSNFGGSIDLVAPGGDTTVDNNGDGYGDGVLSTLGDDAEPVVEYGYDFYQGTSMAAPHVAGVVALMKAVYPGLTAAQLNALIVSGAISEDLGGDGANVRNDSYGYGLIDAQQAVLWANDLAGGAPLPASLGLTPSVLNFGSLETLTQLEVVASNVGDPDSSLTVVSVTESAAWITEVELVEDAGQGLGTYRVTIDRTGLPEAIYSALVSFDTSEGLYTLPVTMQVGTGAAAGDAGFQWVLLLDVASGNVVGTTSAALNTGKYRFSFNNVAPGQYQVVSGSDSDNDGFICDAGESCGGFPLVSELNTIRVAAEDVSGIDFSTGFNTSPGAGNLSGFSLASVVDAAAAAKRRE